MSLYSTLLGNSSYRRQKEGMLRSEAGKRGDDHEKKNEDRKELVGATEWWNKLTRQRMTGRGIRPMCGNGLEG